MRDAPFREVFRVASVLVNLFQYEIKDIFGHIFCTFDQSVVVLCEAYLRMDDDGDLEWDDDGDLEWILRHILHFYIDHAEG